MRRRAVRRALRYVQLCADALLVGVFTVLFGAGMAQTHMPVARPPRDSALLKAMR